MVQQDKRQVFCFTVNISFHVFCIFSLSPVYMNCIVLFNPFKYEINRVMILNLCIYCIYSIKFISNPFSLIYVPSNYLIPILYFYPYVPRIFYLPLLDPDFYGDIQNSAGIFLQLICLFIYFPLLGFYGPRFGFLGVRVRGLGLEPVHLDYCASPEEDPLRVETSTVAH